MKLTLNPNKLPKITTLSDNAKVVLDKRYILKDKEGNPLETYEQLFYRIAKAVAEVERDYVDEDKVDIDKLMIDFYHLMTNMEFLPNSPTIFNAGTPNGQLSACFVLPIHDSMESIFTTLKHAALIHKSGGGTGFDFSELRPKDSTVGSTGGAASGPLSFLKVYDAATEQVKAAGKRRGANMGVLRVDHPDIVDFIKAKEIDGMYSNFNLSVAITDRFMEAVKNGTTYELIDPHTKEVTDTPDARSIYELIVDRAWLSGDPGIIFIDNVNRHNVLPKQGNIASTNPCVTADNWIDTDKGAVQVKDLIGTRFCAIVQGKKYLSTEDGFFFKGNKDVVELETVEGYSLKDTPDHKIQCLVDSELRMVPTEELMPGDKIVLSSSTEYSWVGKHNQFDFGDGYLLGLLIGDGWVNESRGYLGYWDKNADNIKLSDPTTVPTVMLKAAEYMGKYKTRSDYAGWARIKGRDNFILKSSVLRDLCNYFGICNKSDKTITASIEECSSTFLKGLIRGLFDTDGSVQGTETNGFSIRLSQSNLPLLKAVQRILLRFGIVSRLYLNRRSAGFMSLPDGNGGYKEYATKAQHELSITGVYMKLFAEKISFFRDHKLAKLNNILSEYSSRYDKELPRTITATFKECNYIGKEAVFDCTISELHKFSCNGVIVANCGEQPLLPYEACNLGSINLSKMVTNGKSPMVDWAKLKETVHLAIHFLDNVVDASVFPIPEITEKVKQNRKIGLGVMGWADLLFLLGIPYDSERALMLANDVMAFIRREAMAKSKLLATYKRPFPGYEDSVYKERGEGPYRNATVTTVAPTGTLSMIAGCSSGIEPIFALYFVKHVMNGERLAELNPYFMNALKKSKCDSKEVMDAVMSSGSVRGVDGVPDEIKEVFGTAMDISPEYHLRMQAAFQEHIDSAVSKTVNLPNEATREDIDYIYRHAHEWGCKGVTVYRDGCKSVQVLYTGTGDNKATGGEVKEVSVNTTAHVIDPNVGIKPMSRPEELTGFTRSLRTGLGDLYLTVNEYEGRPFEVFATIGRSGRSITAKAEAIGRLVSLALRSGIHVRDVVKQLKGIGGEHPVFQKKGMVLSIPDAVGMVLEQKYLKDEKVVASETGNDLIKPNCPDCGEELVFQEGCLLCPNCAYSKCG